MMLPNGIRRVFRLALRRRDIEQEVRDEIRFHLDARVAELEAGGLSTAAATAQALHEYGDVDASHTELAHVDERRQRSRLTAEWWGSIAQDVRYALRGLRRAPAFTIVMLLTLALGIGANTAVFSVVNALILHPVPYRDADRVMLVWRTSASHSMQITPMQTSIQTWQRDARMLDGLETFDTNDRTLTGRGEPEILHIADVSASFQQFIGLGLLRGRSFRQDETKPGAVDVAVLSEHVWRRQFGEDENILNRVVQLDGRPYTIIGVAPESWRLPALVETRTDVWLPLVVDAKRVGGMTMTRIRPGISVAAAQRELDTLSARLDSARTVVGEEMHSQLTALSSSMWFSQPLLLLAGAVVALLLIACVNVAHLLLARSASRAKEFEIRRALGATRGRVVRQLVIESGIISVCGCALGVLVGFVGLRLLLSLRPASLEAIELASLDHTILMSTAAVAVIAGFGFGLVGAFQSTRTRSRSRLRSILVVTEVALSVALLVGAVLLVRTVVNLQRVDPGFDTADLYAMKFVLPRARYTSPEQRGQFADELLARVRVLPGVLAPTTAGAVPPNPNGGAMFGELEAEGGTRPSRGPGVLFANHVRPDYFSGIGMRLVAGRTFDAGSVDRKDVIVSAGVARTLWPEGNAVGRRFRLKPSSRDTTRSWYTVVAVAPAAAFGGLGTDQNLPLLYFPSTTGTDWGGPTLVFRVRPGASPFTDLRRIALALDPNLVPPTITSVQSAMRESIASQRFTMLLLAIFAGLAAGLSAVGIYGVISYVVTQRTREIGIRIALGGTRAHVARVVAGEGLAMSAIGVGIGLGGAVYATKLVNGLLFGVAATDPYSYLAAGLLLLGASLLACVAPVRRATAVDPLLAMRAE